jgi:hypothetical protein
MRPSGGAGEGVGLGLAFEFLLQGAALGGVDAEGGQVGGAVRMHVLYRGYRIYPGQNQVFCRVFLTVETICFFPRSA